MEGAGSAGQGSGKVIGDIKKNVQRNQIELNKTVIAVNLMTESCCTAVVSSTLHASISL